MSEAELNPCWDCLRVKRTFATTLAAPDRSCAGSREGAQILAIERQDVEGIQPDFVIGLARVQGIEIGNTVNPKDDGCAINELNLLNTEDNKEEFCKQLRNARKQPDQNAGDLQNQVNDFNGLARKLLCCRYTIPHRISKQIQ